MKRETAEVLPIPGDYAQLADFLGEGAPRAWELARKPLGRTLALRELRLLSPVTAPCQILCQGKNYAQHMVETGFRPADQPFNLIFTKSPSALSPPIGSLEKPARVEFLDYELELGLVIGQDILAPRHFDRANLHEVVAGIVMANDVSARDVQVPQGQWFKGKSFRTFCPVGPILCLLEESELACLGDLELELRVNGEVRQNANTNQMIYRPTETLSELSEIVDLRVGDLVLTGTPSGVAMQVKNDWQTRLAKRILSPAAQTRKFLKDQRRSKRYLREGDEIVATIRSHDRKIDLGRQELRVTRPRD